MTAPKAATTRAEPRPPATALPAVEGSGTGDNTAGGNSTSGSGGGSNPPSGGNPPADTNTGNGSGGNPSGGNPDNTNGTTGNTSGTGSDDTSGPNFSNLDDIFGGSKQYQDANGDQHFAQDTGFTYDPGHGFGRVIIDVNVTDGTTTVTHPDGAVTDQDGKGKPAEGEQESSGTSSGASGSGGNGSNPSGTNGNSGSTGSNGGTSSTGIPVDPAVSDGGGKDPAKLAAVSQMHQFLHGNDNTNVAGNDIPGTVSRDDVSGGNLNAHPGFGGDPGNLEGAQDGGGQPKGAVSPGTNFNGNAGSIDFGPDHEETPQTDGPSPRSTPAPTPSGHQTGGQTSGQGSGGPQGSGEQSATVAPRAELAESTAQRLAHDLQDAVNASPSDGHKTAQDVEGAHTGIASVLGGSSPGPDHGAFAALIHAAQNPVQAGLVTATQPAVHPELHLALNGPLVAHDLADLHAAPAPVVVHDLHIDQHALTAPALDHHVEVTHH
jgi:hypothetical protein